MGLSLLHLNANVVYNLSHPTLEIPLTSELTQQSVTQGEEGGEAERRVPKVANSEALHARPLLGVPEKESTEEGRKARL